MRAPLPSLHALKAFEAAARLGAFNKAAEELHLTAASISHHIRQLESDLGVPLFTRSTRNVTLTTQGQSLAQACSNAFNEIHHSVDAIKAADESQTVTIALGSLLASRWLTTQLGLFWEEFPDVELKLVHRSAATIPDSVTADITLSWGNQEQTDARPFLPVSYIPVASPSYLSRFGNPESSADLMTHTLIHQSSTSAWHTWLAANRLPSLDTAEVLIIDDANVALRSAIAGNGIAIGCLPLINADIADGKLVTLFDAIPGYPEGYQLILAPRGQSTPLIAEIADWLCKQVALL